MKYFYNDKLSNKWNEIRASICKLLCNLYIDITSETKKIYPILVKSIAKHHKKKKKMNAKPGKKINESVNSKNSFSKLKEKMGIFGKAAMDEEPL